MKEREKNSMSIVCFDLNSVKEVIEVASKNVDGYNINCLAVDVENGAIIATDGCRLVKRKCKSGGVFPPFAKIIPSEESMKTMLSVVVEKKMSKLSNSLLAILVRRYKNDEKVFLKWNGKEFSIISIDGTSSIVEGVALERGDSFVVAVNPKYLIAALNRVKKLCISDKTPLYSIAFGFVDQNMPILITNMTDHTEIIMPMLMDGYHE